MNTTVTPLLSIVVPTRNRYATLNVIVEQFMAWDSPAFELVIEDNSDDPSGFAETLACHGNDPRLRYRYRSEALSAPENCDRAVARARGEVVTFIGDDDSVTRHCIAAAQWMIDNDIDALQSGVAGYTWPDMEHAVAINKGYNGKLGAFSVAGTVRRIDVRDELAKLARNGAQLLGDMPRLYQALVQRRTLDRMKAEIGTYFPGPVPDMANAVAMSRYIGSAVRTDIPLVVAGQSRSSMSGKNSVRKHQGNLQQEKSLPANTAALWNPKIPEFWSAPTIWAEAAIKGAQAGKLPDFVERFSYARVYAACFAFNDRSFYPMIFKAMGRHGWPKLPWLSIQVAWHFARVSAYRATNLAKKLVRGIPGTGFDTVADAVRHVEAVINDGHYLDSMREALPPRKAPGCA